MRDPPMSVQRFGFQRRLYLDDQLSPVVTEIQEVQDDRSVHYNYIASTNSYIQEQMTDIEAKCPSCTNKASVNEEMTKVRCASCGFTSSYDEYLEVMKSKALQMADNLQLDWDKK